MYLKLKAGELVRYRDHNVLIGDPIDGDRVTVHDPATGRTEVAAIPDLLSPHPTQKIADRPLPTVSKEDWALAHRWRAVIEPLVDKGRVTNGQAHDVAKAFNVSLRTVRRMIERFLKKRLLTAFLPQHHRKGGRGSRRLSGKCEAIVNELIRTQYLHEQRLTVRDLMVEIRRRCKQEGVSPPAENTVRARIADLDKGEVIGRREGRKAAEDETRPVRQRFEVDGPMTLIEIDHTKVDVIIVDEEMRQTIGRAYVTYGIDVFSRCIVGLYVSLEQPDAVSVAMCLTRCVLPKDKWLQSIGVEQPWPTWGKCTRILVDNAREFDSEAFRRGLDQHGIVLEFRPVGQPWFGGHVESSIKTQMRRVHTIPGTTKSNIVAKGEYDAEGNAILTFTELERWLALTAIQYNNEIHSELQTTPIARYNAGIRGDETTPRYGYPPRIIDETRFWLDFLPYERRTIQKYGFQINGIRYYSEVLRNWVHRSDIEGRKFLVAYDKRHMGSVYFLDPELNEYFEISTWNKTRPDFSYWEVERARRLAREKGHREYDEDLIFQLIDERKRVLVEAAAKTKRARREIERARLNQRELPGVSFPALPKPAAPAAPAANDDATSPALVAAPADAVEPVTEFFETEEWK